MVIDDINTTSHLVRTAVDEGRATPSVLSASVVVTFVAGGLKIEANSSRRCGLGLASASGLHGSQRKPGEVGFLGCDGSALPLSLGEHRVWVDFALELGQERRPGCGRCVNWAMKTLLTVGAKAAAEGGYGGVHEEKALSPPTSFPTYSCRTPKGDERDV